jgi:hypothetical protein
VILSDPEGKSLTYFKMMERILDINNLVKTQDLKEVGKELRKTFLTGSRYGQIIAINLGSDIIDFSAAFCNEDCTPKRWYD